MKRRNGSTPTHGTAIACIAIFLFTLVCLASAVALFQLRPPDLTLKWEDSVRQPSSLVERAAGKKDKRMQLVIARYAEDLLYLIEDDIFAPHLSNTIIYNKGEADINEKIIASVKSVRVLPNVGRCDGTYLHHIVEGLKSNTLAHRTLFLPGSCMSEPRKIHALTEALAGRLESGKVMLHEYFNKFEIAEWRASTPENALRNPESSLHRSSVRPFGKWLESVFGAEAARAIYAPIYLGGIFVANSSVLKNRPLAVYENLLAQVSEHSNPEVGHYIERIWGFLLTKP